MWKSNWILFVLVGAASISWAQPKVTVGEPYEVILSPSKYYFSERGDILTLKVDKERIVIQKMDAKTLKFKSVKVYDDFPKDYVIENVVEVQNRYYFLYSIYENDKELLFSREIDFAKGVFVAKGKKILTVSEKLAGALTLNLNHGFRVSDKYDFYFSGDSSLLAVMYRLKPYKHSDKKNYDVIGMHVFDADLNEKWSKKVQMPYTEKAMRNLSYSVDGLGNVYFVSRVFDDNTKADEDDTKYQLKIFKVASGSGVISSTEVGVKDKFVQSVWLYEISEKGTMMCAGLYSNRDDRRDTDGIILFRFGQDGTLANLNLIEIPLEVLNQNVKGYDRRKNERKEGEDEAAFSNLKLEQVIKQPDAGLLIVGEKQYMKTRSDANGNTYMTSHADDILVTKVDAYGKLVWMKKLPKRQRSGSSTGGISYRYFQQSSAHHFLVLDNEKNLDLTETRVPALYIDDGEDGLLTTYEINDKTGNVKKQLILDTRNVNGVELLRFSPTRLVSPLPNTLIFEAYKKKKEDVLIKIEF